MPNITESTEVPSAVREAQAALSAPGPDERVTVQRLHGIPGVEIWRHYASYRRWRVCLPGYLVAALAGPVVSATVRLAGRDHSGHRPHLLTAAPGECITLTRLELQREGSGSWSLCWIIASSEYLLRDVLDLQSGRSWAGGILADERASRSFYRTVVALGAGAEDALLAEECLRKTLRLTSMAGGSAPAQARACPHIVRRAREYLEAHYADQVDLTSLARAVGASKWHLEHSFKSVLGMPLGEYKRHVRAHRALARIRAGGALVTTAMGAGYVDQSHMTREFRKLFGFTPGYYERAIRA